jgi:hypothetical protein
LRSFYAAFAEGDVVTFCGFALPPGISHHTRYTISKASTPGLFSIAGAVS